MVDPDITSRFNAIYNSTSKAVLAFVTAKCRNTADIQDVVQETYVELYQLLIKRGVVIPPPSLVPILDLE